MLIYHFEKSWALNTYVLFSAYVLNPRPYSCVFFSASALYNGIMKPEDNILVYNKLSALVETFLLGKNSKRCISLIIHLTTSTALMKILSKNNVAIMTTNTALILVHESSQSFTF